MRLENTVEVSAPPAAAWDLLMDVPRVIPCMPGAQLVEVVDDSHWKARIDIKLGPVSLSFDADVTRELADADQRRVTRSTVARERRGRGRAPSGRPRSSARSGPHRPPVPPRHRRSPSRARGGSP